MTENSQPNTMPVQALVIRQPDDWHLHLRDGAALGAVVGATARQFARAIIMPNLRTPVTTVAQADAYRDRIMSALRDEIGMQADAFTPLMTLYLTDHTLPSEIAAGTQSGAIHAVKMYPAGATTNSDAGVTDLAKVYPVLEAMQISGLPLLMHGEVTHSSVDIFDREARFIDDVLSPLRRDFPALRIVFEHITTREAAQFVAAEPDDIAATITPQHLLYNRNAIFSGGLRPHWYCLPVLKREHHRRALIDAAVSGSAKFFLGTDSAPHPAALKEHAQGCAGCYSAPYAMALYATAFERAGRLDRLEMFASEFGARFYGLPLNERRVRLIREPETIAERLPFGEHEIVPLAGGEVIEWRFEASGAHQPEVAH